MDAYARMLIILKLKRFFSHLFMLAETLYVQILKYVFYITQNI